MYDMYPWDETARPADRRSEDTSGPDPRITQAVQVALDRRDNGGEATGAQ